MATPSRSISGVDEFASRCREALELARCHATSHGGVAPATAFGTDHERFAAAWAELRRRLDSLPSLSAPGFAAQMAAPPQPAALLGYFAAMLFNANNHDVRHAVATITMEHEVVAQFATMFGLPPTARGHLTGGGTIANLDALWTCRQRRPAGAVALSADAHFAHRRICRLMSVETVTIGCDSRGRMDLDRLEDALRRQRIDTVVVSAGTPGLGAVDPIAAIVALRRRYDFGIHVDASYGGFFTLLKNDADAPIPAPDFAAIAACDSVAIDPHKHGYQPYGCGCVIFRDGGPVAFDQNSPYTDAAPQSGLECSRSGAAAAALWLTLHCLPLAGDEGFGPLLRTCLRAARRLADQLETGEHLTLNIRPQLGIVTFFPAAPKLDSVAMTSTCRRLRDAAAGEGVFLSTLRIATARLADRLPALASAGGETEILRAVLMKPEQAEFVSTLHAALERLMAHLCKQ